MRCFGAATRSMVSEAMRIHDTTPVATAALGRALTAGAMMGCMQKGEGDKVTLSFRGDGPLGGIVVTAGSDSFVKGYVFEPHVDLPLKSNGKLDVSGALGNGSLTVIKDMGLKEPYNGRVDLVSGEIAEDLTYYFASSEQVPSSVGLGVLVNPARGVLSAGGFILQLLPYASEEVISCLEKNLGSFGSVTEHLSAGENPEEMLRSLVSPLDLEVTEVIPTGFRCDCSQERVAQALAALSPGDIREMASGSEDTEVCCHFCKKAYHFSSRDLLGLLEQTDKG